MSKKQHNYYYSFTSPPPESLHTSQSASSAAAGSSPPSYDEALAPAGSSDNIAPTSSIPYYEGYAQNSSVPTFTSSVIPTAIQAIDDAQTAESASAPSLANIYKNGNSAEGSFAGRPAPPQYSLYRATYETVKDGIISRDKHINQDGEALLQFLYQHNNKPPRMIMHFYGYHEETVWITQTYKNNNGETVEERVPTTKRIEDFHFYIDCSADISPVCQGMYISPDPKTGEQKTLRQLCDEYTHSTNALKELKLTKEVSWDYNGLTCALTSAIRNSGYYENVEITFRMEDHKIVVKSDAAVSRWIDNKVLRFLNFITCLWIITLPIVWFCKKRFGHSHLKSSWCMNISERDWYGMHVQEVINSCRGRYAFNGRRALFR